MSDTDIPPVEPTLWVQDRTQMWHLGSMTTAQTAHTLCRQEVFVVQGGEAPRSPSPLLRCAECLRHTPS